MPLADVAKMLKLYNVFWWNYFMRSGESFGRKPVSGDVY